MDDSDLEAVECIAQGKPVGTTALGEGCGDAPRPAPGKKGQQIKVSSTRQAGSHDQTFKVSDPDKALRILRDHGLYARKEGGSDSQEIWMGSWESLDEMDHDLREAVHALETAGIKLEKHMEHWRSQSRQRSAAQTDQVRLDPNTLDYWQAFNFRNMGRYDPKELLSQFQSGQIDAQGPKQKGPVKAPASQGVPNQPPANQPQMGSQDPNTVQYWQAFLQNHPGPKIYQPQSLLSLYQSGTIDAQGRKASKAKNNPYAICNSSLPEGASEEKFKRCKEKVQRKLKSSSRRYRVACMILDEDGAVESSKAEGDPETKHRKPATHTKQAGRVAHDPEEVQSFFRHLISEGLDMGEIMDQLENRFQMDRGELERIVGERGPEDEEPPYPDKEPVWPPQAR